MWAAQLDSPHIFLWPLDSMFLYIHPLLETKFCRNAVPIDSSTISLHRSDVATVRLSRCGKEGISPLNEEIVLTQYIFIQKTQLYYTVCYKHVQHDIQIDRFNELYKILAGAYHRMSLKLQQSYIVRSFGFVPKLLHYRFFCSLRNQRILMTEPQPTRRGEGNLSSMNN